MKKILSQYQPVSFLHSLFSPLSLLYLFSQPIFVSVVPAIRPLVVCPLRLVTD